MDPTQICVRNAGVAKASLTCFSPWLLFRKRCLQLMFIIQKTISPICPPPLWLPSSVLLHSFNLHCASLVSWICPPSRSFPLSTSHRTISFLLHFPPCNLPLLSPLCFPLSCQAQLSKVRKKPAMSAVETSIWTSQRMEHTRKLKAQAPLTQVRKKGTTPIHV
ncbi:hypothetical protein POPTR_008G127651v4 [Populus trichocarpa]|uniref:Uncharacterized protein n=1 Tax=Populus trichocarpa TaxID=3694 RepID=A0ACC0SLD6_POPTR|nr:hypothetical protein POPTR_008G127651v4 [Populus trichocarpa]